MSIAVPLYGFGIGGSSLYYSVVCSTTEPAKKEGRIWVKSGVPMTELEFGKTWTSAAVGTTVIGGALGGANPTSANKMLEIFYTKLAGIYNRMKVNPESCKQVQGSAGNWVSVDAYVCHSDTWIQFSSVFSATINITYPAGSTCTCSDGTTTLSAPDTSGTWACIVPNAGTWTAAATDGVENTSESVSITTDGQTVAVELSYYTYLFKPNTDTTNVTGGWQLNSKGSLDSAGEQLVATFTNAYNHGIAFNVATINKIDFTEFTTLVATCKAADNNNAAPRSATFAVASTQSGFNNAGTASTKIASTTFSNSTTTVTIDVSGISGSYYVTFVVELSNYNTGTLTVDEVKLMK